MIKLEAQADFSLEFQHDADGWSFSARLNDGVTLPSRPLDSLFASSASMNVLEGAGEVFWSALLFDALGYVDDPDVFCFCLDIPCAELRHIPSERRCLLYNPTSRERTVLINDGQRLVLPPGILFTAVRG